MIDINDEITLSYKKEVQPLLKEHIKEKKESDSTMVKVMAKTGEVFTTTQLLVRTKRKKEEKEEREKEKKEEKARKQKAIEAKQRKKEQEKEERRKRRQKKKKNEKAKQPCH